MFILGKTITPLKIRIIVVSKLLSLINFFIKPLGLVMKTWSSDVRKRQVRKYDLIDEATDLINEAENHTMVNYDRLITLYQQCSFQVKNKIIGDFVECGVWKGGCSYIMGSQILKDSSFKLILFDSFCGMPKATLNDSERDVRRFGLKKIGEISGSGGNSTSSQNVRHLLMNKLKMSTEQFEIYEGWFEETVPIYAKSKRPISILRLDGDFYESTLTCLQFLYNNVVSGGLIIIDDYKEHVGCEKAVHEFFGDNLPYLHHIANSGARYIVKK